MKMLKVKFIDHEETERVVGVAEGKTVMEAAIDNMVPGIDAECGGACGCATCHVYVHEAWFDKLPAKEDMEASMLDFAENVKETSRLGCQIKLDKSLDGLTVKTPEAQ